MGRWNIMTNEYVICPGCGAKLQRSSFEKTAGTDMSRLYHDDCRHQLIIRGDEYPIFDPIPIFHELSRFKIMSKRSWEAQDRDTVFSESHEWPLYRLIQMFDMCVRHFPVIQCRFLEIDGKHRIFLGGK